MATSSFAAHNRFARLLLICEPSAISLGPQVEDESAEDQTETQARREERHEHHSTPIIRRTIRSVWSRTSMATAECYRNGRPRSALGPPRKDFP